MQTVITTLHGKGSIMTILRSAALFLTMLLAIIVGLSAAQDPPSTREHAERALVTQISQGNYQARSRALEIARSLGPDNMGDELRGAIIRELQREARVHVQRYSAERRGQPLPPLEDPEFIARAASVVADLKDPRAIPALAETLGIGFVTIHALADFGQQAAPAVVQIVMSPESTHYAVDDGLITLRLMVERMDQHPLNADTLARIRQAAEHHLTVRQRFIGTTWWAIDLAATLKDPSLRRIVELIASDPSQAVSRGAEDSDDVLQTQMRANDRLAGVPPLPRPEPER